MTTSTHPAASAAPGAAARPSGRRRPLLTEIVRDLAGWTPPACPSAPARQPAGWQLA